MAEEILIYSKRFQPEKMKMKKPILLVNFQQGICKFYKEKILEIKLSSFIMIITALI